MSISIAVRNWLIEPILEALKKTEVRIMSETAKDVDAETTKLAGIISTTVQDVLAQIKALKDAQATGADLTTQVNNLIALEAPLQALDDQAKAIATPPAA